MAEIPTRVKVLAAIVGISGIWSIIRGILGMVYETPILEELTYMLIALGVVTLGVAYGLYRGYKWSWVVAMVLVTLSALVVVYQYYKYGTMDYLTLIMDAVLAVALISSADYYGVEIPILPKPKTATATTKMVEEMRFFRRL